MHISHFARPQVFFATSSGKNLEKGEGSRRWSTVGILGIQMNHQACHEGLRPFCVAWVGPWSSLWSCYWSCLPVSRSTGATAVAFVNACLQVPWLPQTTPNSKMSPPRWQPSDAPLLLSPDTAHRVSLIRFQQLRLGAVVNIARYYNNSAYPAYDQLLCSNFDWITAGSPLYWYVRRYCSTAVGTARWLTTAPFRLLCVCWH